MRRTMLHVAVAATLLAPLVSMAVYAHPTPFKRTVDSHQDSHAKHSQNLGSQASPSASVAAIQAAIGQLNTQSTQFVSTVQGLAQTSTTQSVYQSVQPIVQPLLNVTQQLQAANTPQETLAILQTLQSQIETIREQIKSMVHQVQKGPKNAKRLNDQVTTVERQVSQVDARAQKLLAKLGQGGHSEGAKGVLHDISQLEAKMTRMLSQDQSGSDS